MHRNKKREKQKTEKMVIKIYYTSITFFFFIQKLETLQLL